MPLSRAELGEIEGEATVLAEQAGRLLLDRFRRPLTIEYKGDQAGKNPVTDADRAAELFLVEELGRRYPGHAVVGEEGTDNGVQESPLSWVIDPLDGTTNYLNGLPLFACSIALVEEGVPVVAAVFIPWPTESRGRVFHGSKDGGAWVDETRLQVTPEEQPVPGRVAVLSGVFGGWFKLRESLRRSPGERRSVGSIAYELALVADGTYQYALFGSPHSWDVAAGVLLAQEAGGVVQTRRPGRGGWTPFERFAGPTGAFPDATVLREWVAPILAGNRAMVQFVGDGIAVRRNLRRSLGHALRRPFRRPRPAVG